MHVSTTARGQTTFLLPAYILFETVRAVFTYAAIHSHVPVSSTFITFGYKELSTLDGFKKLIRPTQG